MSTNTHDARVAAADSPVQEMALELNHIRIWGLVQLPHVNVVKRISGFNIGKVMPVVRHKVWVDPPDCAAHGPASDNLRGLRRAQFRRLCPLVLSVQPHDDES